MSFLQHSTVNLEANSLRPLRDMVLVVIDERETVSTGGVLIPHIARGLPNQGRVVAVGPLTTVCTPGDHVVIEKYAHGDRPFVMLGEPPRRHVLCKHEQVISVLTAREP